MFDLSQVMAQAVEAKTQQDEGNGGKGPKLVYPQPGTLRVKLLFNPASGLVSKKVVRHQVEGAKVPCLSAYGQDCPVCQTVTSIQNSKGLDLWKLKASTRGISYAQYVSSDYNWNNPADEPKQGELVLLMYPWTVYQELNRIIADAGSLAGTVVASNSGKVIKISRWTESSQVKYKAEIDAFAGEFTSCNSDDEFNDFLTKLENLNEKITPATLSDAIIKQAKEVSQQLTANYLGAQIASTMVNPVAQPQYPQQPQGGQAYQQPQYQQPVPPQYQPPVQQPQPQYQPPVQQPVAPPQETTGYNPQQGFNAQPQQPQYQPPAGFGAGFAPQSPGVQQPTPSSEGGQAVAKPQGAPECFGMKNSGTANPNMCMLCPHELVCNSASK